MVFSMALSWHFRVIVSLVFVIRRLWVLTLSTAFFLSSFSSARQRNWASAKASFQASSVYWILPCSWLEDPSPSSWLHAYRSSFHNHIFSSLADMSHPITNGFWHESLLSHSQVWCESLPSNWQSLLLLLWWPRPLGHKLRSFACALRQATLRPIWASCPRLQLP